MLILKCVLLKYAFSVCYNDNFEHTIYQKCVKKQISNKYTLESTHKFHLKYILV